MTLQNVKNSKSESKGLTAVEQMFVEPERKVRNIVCYKLEEEEEEEEEEVGRERGRRKSVEKKDNKKRRMDMVEKMVTKKELDGVSNKNKEKWEKKEGEYVEKDEEKRRRR
ncbi:hypothetical protein LSTR_LSTR015379 [Laodelphax striatellus]|uniref:Uncharacterized protein n=1 Tax=Laodelphax striatellus TaxID=195883 RepID=A0A482WHE1_LAOST|nr:hypothetical protein LSTR_LSTR015379 [Laodelphax striatellus]